MDQRTTAVAPRILFIGGDWDGSNATSCRRAFKQLGCQVASINEREFAPPWESVRLRLARRLLRPSLVREFNHSFVRAVTSLRPDLVFVFKGVLMRASSVAFARHVGTMLFNFYPDVDLVKHYRQFGNDFLAGVSHYHCVFTPKRYHYPALEAACARRIEFLPYAYDPDCHAPASPTADDRVQYGADVAVIATWGQRRAAMLEELVSSGFPYRLVVWGNQWDRLDRTSPLRRYVKFRHVTGIEMSLALACSKVVLAFLSPPDLHTSRTFEIPASGAFMLAERTSEHLEFFREGEEIACFESVDELRSQIHHFLAHDRDRQRIAEAGRRAVEGRHDYRMRMARVLEVYQEMVGAPASDCTQSVGVSADRHAALDVGRVPTAGTGVSVSRRDGA